MRVVFMGTPDFAVPTLESLIDAPDFDVVAVITQPDRPAGRGKQLRPSPVKTRAQAHHLPIFQPEKLRGKAVMEQLRSYEPDFHIVAAYGQILRQAVLDLPTYGSINVHASLLPRWRGAAPIQAAILHGDHETGITIMQMDTGLDTGPMLKKQALPIAPDETGQSLHDKLAALGGPLLLDTLRGIIKGEIEATPQAGADATYAPRIDKSDGCLDWQENAIAIERRIRAFFPWPGTFSYWEGQMLKIVAGQALPNLQLAPGKVAFNQQGHALVIGCGEGAFAPNSVQMAGRKAMSAKDFVNGFAEIEGAVLKNEV